MLTTGHWAIEVINMQTNNMNSKVKNIGSHKGKKLLSRAHGWDIKMWQVCRVPFHNIPTYLICHTCVVVHG